MPALASGSNISGRYLWPPPPASSFGGRRWRYCKTLRHSADAPRLRLDSPAPLRSLRPPLRSLCLSPVSPPIGFSLPITRFAFLLIGRTVSIFCGLFSCAHRSNSHDCIFVHCIARIRDSFDGFTYDSVSLYVHMSGCFQTNRKLSSYYVALHYILLTVALHTVQLQCIMRYIFH